jgi:hypothetical protein
MQLAYLKILRLLPLLTILLPLCLISAPLAAEGFQITPFIGYRSEGSLADINTGAGLDIAADSTVGFTLAKDIGQNRQIEFYYSRQSSDLSGDPAITPGFKVDIDVEYIHFGSKHYLGNTGMTYLVGSIGGTRLSSKSSVHGSETPFSLGVGGGIETGRDKRVGFRLEGRGFATFTEGSTQIFCNPSGTCTGFSSNDILFQFVVNAGVSFRF